MTDLAAPSSQRDPERHPTVEWRKVAPAVLPGAAVLVTAVILIWRVWALAGGPPPDCAKKDQFGPAQQAGIVAACVFAFLLGGLLGRIRKSRHEGGISLPAGDDDADLARAGIRHRALHFLRTGRGVGPHAARRGARWVHGGLAVIYLCGVCALAYETVGVWPGNPWGLQPITHYVRCARGLDLGWTAVVAGTFCFLAGHWLWWPNYPKEKTSP